MFCCGLRSPGDGEIYLEVAVATVVGLLLLTVFCIAQFIRKTASKSSPATVATDNPEVDERKSPVKNLKKKKRLSGNGATRKMDWQGGDYSFLGISACWRRLGVGVENLYDFNEWRDKYPVTVAVLDSGIMKDHDAFKHLRDAVPGAIQGKNFIDNQSGQDIADPPDKGHGTQCAAIIAGGEYDAVDSKMSSAKQRKNEFPFWNGLAPFVNLYICKIDQSISSLIAAIKHLIKEKKGNRVQVDVISISVGIDEYDADLQKCIQEASLNNIIVVCAASNDGRQSSNSIVYPARYGDVICVGSHDHLGNKSTFASVGREIDILGPGEIRSACPVPGKPKVKNAVVNADGTSYAAPYVAGMVAIILANAQRIGEQKRLNLRSAISNNVVMKQILREMASEPGDHTQFRGHGTLDPLRIFDYSDDYFRQVLESITSLSPSPEPDLNLRNYDHRKVAIKLNPEDLCCADEIQEGTELSSEEPEHMTCAVELQGAVVFSSRMDSINLSLPKLAEPTVVLEPQHSFDYHEYIINCLLPYQDIEEKRSIDLEVFCNKINKEVTDRKISCLVLPSPSDAAYGTGNNKLEGSAALQEFLTQLGGDLVSNVEHLWLNGGETGENKLSFSDINKTMQTLQELKSAGSGQLTVHCENVQIDDITSADCHLSQEEIPDVDVIIHQRNLDERRYLKGRELKGIPNYVNIEECPPECQPYHYSSVSEQAASYNQGSEEDMACDFTSLEQPASQDGAAALYATMQKHQCHLKAGVCVTVAVLGSGIYMDHKDFAEVVTQDKACFVPEESWDLSVDTLGTGTALASIATWFAPEKTRLLIAKVMDEQGISDQAWVAKAVEWATNHDTDDDSHPADIILIPVGFEKFHHGMFEAVTEAQKNGKIVIAAAAHSPVAQEISYPARHGDVICVGCHSRTSSASSHSVRGREMDFLMLGEEHPVKAVSARTGKSYNSSVSGTSVAAAMATAVVGFTLMYAESVGGKSLRDKLKSNTMIRELLREACSSRGFHTPDRGYGTLDPDKLFKWGPQHFKDLVKKIAKSS
ncbi:MBTPS1 [Branchiostoma lanceolatum]|uniref:MBTPS1 protein n=1 Tax=Branchiostoma lanceolatum TaxID=7740 RepID=A0A8J9YUJ4_BRALA|nr:MBTPS1 [Branchiostoma lanceolatum]